ncbi:MAG: tRNA (adenosine(37)-N6)-threonylcarbamoyltransferase complex transferase subunit TsaD [Chloroflexi bacterium]|nr:tRNA (adenosine(37)-N6)-threonylcarbamoyltransferase complex transferase subunit TsaD [Chloroflexota bacterium]MQC26156.1 tRNA (adenosine(37)-N6)-threonylcarbamoyltransferase complex transferase subunit TsaD [Chloroflexota bacterium]
MSPEAKLAPARILGIETSCDETAVAVVEDGRRALSNVVASQAELHAEYGGVFPEVASRQHVKVIDAVLEAALKQAHLELADVDAIAVTRGPGLPGSLVVGLNMAKGLALGSGKPLYGINHIEGHLYSAWVQLEESQKHQEPKFPLLALVVSGGHTELIIMRDHLRYERLGGTLDDAAGEAFDKIARLMGLGYPGGPAIQKAAEGGKPDAFNFPRAWLDGTWNFSFSGLKTAVLHQVRELAPRSMQDALPLPDMPDTRLPIANLAASFQAAVVDVLVGKTKAAAEAFKAKHILVAGGVSANQALREGIQEAVDIPVHLPPLALCTDNAAMIAVAGYYRHALARPDDLNIDVSPGWLIESLQI